MGRHRVSRHGTTTSLCDQCRTESCLAAPAGDGGATALSLCRCEASRLSGAEAAGRPGSRPPASVRRSSRRSRRGRGPISAGSWHALIDDWSRDTDMPQRVSEGRPSGLVAGASASFYGMAAARVRRHRRALQRLAHVRATRGSTRGRAARQRAQTAHRGVRLIPPTRTVRGSGEGDVACERPANVRCPWHKTRGVSPLICAILTPGNARVVFHQCPGICVTDARRSRAPCQCRRRRDACPRGGDAWMR